MRGAGSRATGDETLRNAFDKHLLLHRTLTRAMDTSSTIRARFTLSTLTRSPFLVQPTDTPYGSMTSPRYCPINEYPVFKYGVFGNGYRYDQ